MIGICSREVRVRAPLKQMSLPTGKGEVAQKVVKAAGVAAAINMAKAVCLITGLLFITFLSASQSRDSSYTKRKLSETEIQAAFSYYTQDNDHSAVTGGKGTEDLQVYSSQFNITFVSDSVKRFQIDGGVDVISSASTDQIDYVVSSASRVDARTHLQMGYEKTSPTHLTLGGKASFSLESDYFSKGVEVHMEHEDVMAGNRWGLSLQTYFDDLRWGRLENGKPQKLIYPVELRGTEWFDHYRRNSFNLSGEWVRTINERVLLAILPGISYQHGLLSTPFHRIYFTDGSEQVENLPEDRWKFPIGIRLNSFIGSMLVAQGFYRFYHDSFGINAHTLSIEIPVKFTTRLTVSPFARCYHQQGTRYFHPYGQHDPESTYFTSDYDLSDFNSLTVGSSLRLSPLSVNPRHAFRVLEVRYSAYLRDDGLRAHIISTYFDLSFLRE